MTKHIIWDESATPERTYTIGLEDNTPLGWFSLDKLFKEVVERNREHIIEWYKTAQPGSKYLIWCLEQFAAIEVFYEAVPKILNYEPYEVINGQVRG